MATRTALVSSAYTQVAADISTLKLIQCPTLGSTRLRCIELVAAAELPAVTVRGVELMAGETITSGNIGDIGTSGKLYAKPAWGSSTGEVLTL